MGFIKHHIKSYSNNLKAILIAFVAAPFNKLSATTHIQSAFYWLNHVLFYQYKYNLDFSASKG